MEKIDLITDNAACGLTDISGVKNEPNASVPEQSGEQSGHVAGDGKNGGLRSSQKESANVCGEGKTGPSPSEEATLSHGITDLSADAPECVSTACDISDEEKEDREFSALIKGRYRDAYRRRTESIIRRRLRSVGRSAAKEEAPVISDGKVDSPSLGSGALMHKEAESVSQTHPDVGAVTGTEICADKKDSYVESQRAVNRSRPRENGVGGSVGMFTGINVSALKGRDILDILRRAETGEKIKFQ